MQIYIHMFHIELGIMIMAPECRKHLFQVFEKHSILSYFVPHDTLGSDTSDTQWNHTTSLWSKSSSPTPKQSIVRSFLKAIFGESHQTLKNIKLQFHHDFHADWKYFKVCLWRWNKYSNVLLSQMSMTAICLALSVCLCFLFLMSSMSPSSHQSVWVHNTAVRF